MHLSCSPTFLTSKAKARHIVKIKTVAVGNVYQILRYASNFILKIIEICQIVC